MTSSAEVETARRAWAVIYAAKERAPDITPDFEYRESDARVGRLLLKCAETPKAIRVFDEHCKALSSSAYWFYLSTLWVSYSGWSDLDLWKRLFSSPRKYRETSLMKPSELAFYRALPETIHAFRAHRPGEEDWIAYTLSSDVAARFAAERGIESVGLYEIPKAAALAYFTRRGEAEILVLDKANAKWLRDVPVVTGESVR